MTDFKYVYEDRYDPAYLAYLEEQLDIENLKRTALDNKKTIKGIDYHKCISIDFCGLAASTIFYKDIDNEAVNGKNLEALRKVSVAFRKIFERNTLLELNNDDPNKRFYVRAKFCFSYLHSDFPICLMKAEQNDVWENLADKPVYDYYINRPLNKSEFKNSEIRQSQEASLSAIIDILKNNDDLIILGGEEKNINSIQARFSLLPSTICTLIINDTAYCDPYFYAKLGKQKYLSLTYPIQILKGSDEYMIKAFQNICKHFRYLWRHDLTLYCSDATSFSKNNKEGLINILSPELVVGPNGTNWVHKEARIWEMKEELAKKKLNKTSEDLKHIRDWKANLNKKFAVCTRKIKEDEDKNINETTITIGMKRKFYYFRIWLPAYDVAFEYLDKKATLLYRFIAHYAYAELTNEKPVMHEYHTGRNRLERDVKTALKNHDLDRQFTNKAKWIQYDEIFQTLFSQFPNPRLQIEKLYIDFESKNLEEIRKLNYPAKIIGAGRKMLGCLDFGIR